MEKLLKLRHLALFAALFMFLNALGMILVGVMKSFKGLTNLLGSLSGPEFLMPGKLFAESTDTLLMGIVFLILALNIVRIFDGHKINNDNLPNWLNVADLKSLKVMVWEALLLMLTLLFATEFFVHVQNLNDVKFEVLILPASILLLALGLKFVRE